MKKKIALGMLCALLTCGGAAGIISTTNADSEGAGYLPIRQTFEEDGYTIGWDGAARSITIENGDKAILLKAGSDKAVENGSEIQLSAPVMLIGGTAYIAEEDAELLKSAQRGSGAAAVNTEGKSLAYRINAQMNQNENYVFSPFSLKSAMAMAANGAAGATQSEMLSALGYTDINTLNADMRAVNTLYNKAGDIKLSTADSLWINEDYPELKSEFAKALKDNYDAETDKGTPTSLPPKIKAWVNEKSNGLQKDFNVELDDDFAMAIINTTYLKAKWQSQFDADLTGKREFTNADGSKSQTDFMHDTFYQDMYKDKDVQMVKLGYRDAERDFSFYAAIAPDGTDLESYIPKLTNREIMLSLPRFKGHTNMNMNGIVNKLGAGTMFTKNADFSGIFGSDYPVFVSQIIQDTVIDVDEEGTEAASTTMMAMCGTAAMKEPPVEMTFDRPFTYFIRDNDSGEILFMGRFASAE